MSTKTVGWLIGARDGQKLGSGWDPVYFIPTLSQPGPFQTFAEGNFRKTDKGHTKVDFSYKCRNVILVQTI